MRYIVDEIEAEFTEIAGITVPKDCNPPHPTVDGVARAARLIVFKTNSSGKHHLQLSRFKDPVLRFPFGDSQE